MADNVEKKKGKSPVMMILTVFVVLTISCGVAFYAVKLLHKDGKPKGPLVNTSLKQEMIDFTFKMMPELYNGLAAFDFELVLIDKEIERLGQMTEQYPRQTKIIIAEKNTWINTRKNIYLSLSNLEKNIETIYVTYSVDEKGGLELMKEKEDELKRSIEETLNSSQEYTNRLKPKEKTFLEKMKEKL